ncbi:MAG TPA: CoA transferase [Acidimicrobiales bacterium]|nr:CoA transferase [Acidimicrobiales bacterium]
MTEGVDPPAGDATAAWAASGAMALTGHADGPPLAPAAAVVPALEAAARSLTRLARARGASLPIDVGPLLSGRAGRLGLHRQGRTSANGSCRLLATADGWAAVNLARPTDVSSVGAVIGRTVDDDPWAALTRAAERMAGGDLVERATLLGVPAAVVPAVAAGQLPAPAPTPAPFTLHQLGPRSAEAGYHRPLVVDLSALWAGPLCAHLLGRAGLRIVKVESTRRPDGARAGDARFYGWLHGGHESVALDLSSSGGRAALGRLVAAADVIVESSRPRALAQLGIDVEAVLAGRPGTTWVSITGHGRRGDAAQRVAFGDDAAVAAGLVAHDDQGAPVFCGDAIADPVTGLSAALGALTSLAAGGGHLVDVPMVDAVAATLRSPAVPAAAHRSPTGTWLVSTPTGSHPVAPPHQLPPPTLPARPMGADTTIVLQGLGIPLDSAATPC